MKRSNYISADEFFSIWSIELSLINSPKENGLIESVAERETTFIDVTKLCQLEKLIRFYFELDINVEGIDSILQLLQRINALHDENIALRNRLHLFEKT